MGQDFSRELAVALHAVRSAEVAIMQKFGGDHNVLHKADLSPVSTADLEAEHIIVKILRQEFPDHRILSEESGESGGRSEFEWVVDPIDGTKNYIRGIPLFGTQLALTKDGVPMLGISNLPAMGELLYAESGRGAYCNGRAIGVSDVRDLALAHLSLGGPNHFIRNGLTAQLFRITRAVARVRAFGDAYAYHLVATGRCEVVVEVGCHYWDVAALSIIVQEAGGTCTDLIGHPIGRETTNVIFSNGKVHSGVLATLQDSLTDPLGE